MTRNTRSRAVVFVLAASVLSFACGDDTTQGTSTSKGVVDRAALLDGVQVTISGNIGSVSVPFTRAVPEADEGGTGGTEEDFQNEVEGAISLMVTQEASGTTVNLSSGDLVSGNPSSPGEWTCELNSDRDLANLEFFNETAAGQALSSANDYTAALTISLNDYIETESSFAFSVDVVGN